MDKITMDKIKCTLNILSAIFGLLAAFLWWKSAMVEIPVMMWAGTLQEEQLKKQSRLSAKAAKCAAMAAICQSVLTLL